MGLSVSNAAMYDNAREEKWECMAGGAPSLWQREGKWYKGIPKGRLGMGKIHENNPPSDSYLLQP